MAGIKISALPAGTTVASDDLIPYVDVSDTSEAATGTTKYMEKSLLGIPTSGTWTPTISGETYGEIVVVVGANYTRIGNIVSCSFFLDIELDAAQTEADFQISLPVPSNFAIGKDAFGIVAYNGDNSEFVGWELAADPATDKLSVVIGSTTAGWAYQFIYVICQYQVI
jgi:hypothetical protein